MKKKNTDKENYGLADDYPDFSQLIKSVRKNAGLTADQIAKLSHVHANSQGYYENKKRLPPIEYLISFSCSIGIPFWQLLRRRIELGDAPEQDKRAVLNEIGPLYQHLYQQPTHRISEQKPAHQDHAVGDPHHVVAACCQLLGRHQDNPHIQIFHQDGNSMAPTLNEGDTLFIDTSKKHLTEGDIFVIQYGDSHSAKRVQLAPNGGILLIPDNSQYHTVNLSKEEVVKLTVLGKLVSTISHYD